jgi:secreted PhoX family phosphatase
VADLDEDPSNPDPRDTLGDVLDRRLTRRRVLGGLAAGAAALALPRPIWAREPEGPEGPLERFGFEEIPGEIRDTDRVAEGHEARVLLRWGDPVLPEAAPFDPRALTAESQARRFGFNNDFTAFLPLPRGSGGSDHGLLCVNHEYTDARLLWTGETAKGSSRAERVLVEMAAHGHSVVEVRREKDGWRVVPESRYARRITANTPMGVSGPARGHSRLKTVEDPLGQRVLGTLNNCGGGTTPWGTVLVAEENFHEYFAGDLASAGSEAASLRRYGIRGKPAYRWDLVDPRFDLAREPCEANRFGWVVELDPYDPASAPMKRTALGRLKHEAATVVVAPDGRVVVYSGDDEAFEFLYRFVSEGRYDPARAAANADLLDAGTLSAARFEADGTCRWLPLVFGNGPLAPENGFRDQGDVLIEARRAAQLLGATPMDRPEDVEADSRTGRVYVMLTNNVERQPSQVDGANPRPRNVHGHVLEIRPRGPGGHASDEAGWEVLLLAGEPTGTTAPRLSCPDNAAFDPQGRLWIATDQGDEQNVRGIPDGLFACETSGPQRGEVRLFYACPRGAELCGPTFTPDGRALFVSVQHPGGGLLAPGGPVGTFERPATRWPDFRDGLPPRPSVVVITRRDGGPVGG